MYGITMKSGRSRWQMAESKLYDTKGPAQKACYAYRRGFPNAQFAVVWLGDADTWKVLA